MNLWKSRQNPPGILGAVAAGVAIGLLFYTEEGKNKKKIKNTTNDWADSLGSVSLRQEKKDYLISQNKAAKEASHRMDKLRGKAEGLYSESERWVCELINKKNLAANYSLRFISQKPVKGTIVGFNWFSFLYK